MKIKWETVRNWEYIHGLGKRYLTYFHIFAQKLVKKKEVSSLCLLVAGLTGHSSEMHIETYIFFKPIIKSNN